MTFQVSDAAQKPSPVSDGSENKQLNSVDILQSSQQVESTNKIDTAIDSNVTTSKDSVVPNFTLDENGTAEIVSKDEINEKAPKFKLDKNGSGEITSKDESKPYPPSLELIDEPKESSLENKTPLTEAEKETYDKLKEAIDSANFEDIYKTVKQFKDNPKGLEKISQALAKELKPYGMTAKVEYPQNADGTPNTKNPSEANLVLSQMYDTGDELHKDSISFSTKPGADAFQRQTSEAKDGSGGGGGPLRPSANGQEGTVSNVLRRMSHDRTH